MCQVSKAFIFFIGLKKNNASSPNSFTVYYKAREFSYAAENFPELRPIICGKRDLKEGRKSSPVGNNWVPVD